MTQMAEIAKIYLKCGRLCRGYYKEEVVRIDDYDRAGNVCIWIPSRQESVWVSGDNVELVEVKHS